MSAVQALMAGIFFHQALQPIYPTAVARHGKRIYVLGGISNRNVLNSVEMATVTSGP